MNAKPLNQLPLGLLVTDEAGCILQCNNVISKIVDISEDDLINKKIIDLIDDQAGYPYSFFRNGVARSGCGVVNFKAANSSTHYHVNVMHLMLSTSRFYWLFAPIDSKSEQIFEEQQKEQYLNSLFKLADAIFVIQADLGIILQVNTTASELLGFSKEELIGRHISSLFPEDFSQEYMQKFISAEWTVKHPITRTSIVGREGLIIPVEIKNAVVKEVESQYIIGSYRDLSDRIHWEQALTESENRYRTLFNSVKEGIVIVSPISQRIYLVNSAICEMLGYEENELLNQNFSILRLELEKHHIDKKGYSMGLLCRHKYGASIYVDIRKSSVCIDKDNYNAYYITDVTEQKRNSDQLNNIINLSMNLIFIADLDGLLIRINPAFQRVLGHTEAELVNYPIYNFLHHNDIIATKQLIEIELAKGEVVTNFQTRLLSKSGEEIWISWAAQPMPNEKRVFAIGRNVTVEKKAEMEILEAKIKAEESDRLKSAFLANMSHEIRTPMNAIIGFSTLLDNDALEHSKRKKYTEVIRSRCNDLLRIINDILDISRIEAGQLDILHEEFDLNTLLQEIYELHTQNIRLEEKQHIEFVLNKPDDSIIVNNDRQRITQVLNNILDNAIKFTSDGTISFGCTVSDTEVVFCISDTGIGISREKHEIIFKRFRQAEENLSRKYGGNGLGLAISKPLVMLMGGDIWLESDEGKGSTFYFSVKRNMLTPTSDDEFLWLKDKRILLVEDDKHSIEYIRLLLEQLGIDLKCIRNGIDAIEVLKNDKGFDLVLLDIQLTDISGLDVARSIRESNLQIPIIAQTAYARQVDRKQCMEAGCNAYITKPVDDEELLSLVAKYLKTTTKGDCK